MNKIHIKLLDGLLTREPFLNSRGFGTGMGSWGKESIETRNAILKAERAELRNSVDKVFWIAAWLKANISPVKKPKISSYSMTHLAETATNGYVSNGAFIAAAILAGYPYKITGINADFGMKRADIKKVTKILKKYEDSIEVSK